MGSKIVDAVLVVCALAMVGLVARSQLARPVASPEMAAPDSIIADYQSYHDSTRRAGPAQASAEIVVFTDYQCPYCRALWHALDSLQSSTGVRPAVTIRHFPLDGVHPQARAAAAFSECARIEGKFRVADSLLVAWPDSVGSNRWHAFAVASGLSAPESVETCMRSPTIVARIDQDVAAGRRLGIRGTPVLLVDNQRVQGTRSVAGLLRLIEAGARR